MSDLERGVVLSPSTVEAMKRLAQGKATSEQGAPWAAIEDLRARVEALEENATADIVDYYAALSIQSQGRAVFHDNSKLTSNQRQTRSSLMERVAEVMPPWDDGAIYARAAIQVVAAWLVDQHADSDGFIQSNVGCVIGQLHEEAGSTLKKENFNA